MNDGPANGRSRLIRDMNNQGELIGVRASFGGREVLLSPEEVELVYAPAPQLLGPYHDIEDGYTATPCLAKTEHGPAPALIITSPSGMTVGLTRSQIAALARIVLREDVHAFWNEMLHALAAHTAVDPPAD